jgi:heme/copper-type cytochrome/quinol oxidase subunit 4
MDAEGLITFIITVILTVIPTWRIVRRTGFNPALSLLIIIPAIGPLILLIVLAFGNWPSLKTSTER